MIYKKYNKKFKLTYTKMLDKKWLNRKINPIAKVDENAKNVVEACQHHYPRQMTKT